MTTIDKTDDTDKDGFVPGIKCFRAVSVLSEAVGMGSPTTPTTSPATLSSATGIR